MIKAAIVTVNVAPRITGPWSSLGTPWSVAVAIAEVAEIVGACEELVQAERTPLLKGSTSQRARLTFRSSNASSQGQCDNTKTRCQL